jgi:hypothetical protein
MSGKLEPFPREKFLKFCSYLKILTKDFGLIKFKLLGSQQYMLDEICKGMDEGVANFVALKSRQLGSSTFFMALDLFWAFNFKGVSGAIITHNEQLRDQFRSMLTIYLQNLPPWAKKTATRHSRTQLQFDNGSIFQYLVAGTKDTSKGQMGTGASFNYLHKSEESAYGNPEDLKNLEAACSSHYPHRLYINETTARGFNHFEKTWEYAAKSPSYRIIFVGWWRNELFRFERDDPRFQAYVGAGDLSKIDVLYRKRIREVKELYDFDIAPEQMAWYLARVNEPPYSGDQDKMDEDFPFTPEMAFITTGSRFFTNQSITDQMRRARNQLLQPFKYQLGYDWRETRLTPIGQAKRADLKIWEEADPMGRYIVSCDPAYGSSEDADRTCIQVCRAYADRLVQVAEFCSVWTSTHQCAWVLAHLCGYYRNVRMMLEIAGPGQAVDGELKNLRNQMPQMFSGDDTQLRNCLSGIQYYLYRRGDSMSGSVQYQWKMNNEQKHRMMNQLKDSVELDRLVINSLEALNECKTIIRDAGYIEAETGEKDDRVIALGMANHAWLQWEQGPLRQNGMTMLRAEEMKKAGTQGIVQDRMVANYLENMKMQSQSGQQVVPFARPFRR